MFHLFPKFENITCSTRQVIVFWTQTISFLQLFAAVSVQQASRAVARLGRKGLKETDLKTCFIQQVEEFEIKTVDVR